MKYFNFIMKESGSYYQRYKGLVPTRHLHHRSYRPITDKNTYITIHDLIDHSIKEDGSFRKELLAVGALIYRTNCFIHQIIHIIVDEGTKFYTKLPDYPDPIKEFNDKAIDYHRLKYLYLHYSYKSVGIDEMWEHQWKRIYNTIGHGYKLARERKNYNIDKGKLEQQVTEILEKDYPVDKKVKIPISLIQ